MRLLTKTTIYFFSAMVGLLLLAGIYLFHQFSKQLNNRSDKELIADEIAWIQYLAAQLENGTTFIMRSPSLSVYPVNEPAEPYPLLTDVHDYVPGINEKVLFRQLSQVVSVGGISYQVILKKSQEQKAALVSNFTRIMLIVFAGLFVATIVFIQLINRRLWSPFNHSLQQIRNAGLEQMKVLHFGKTNIREFNELNASLKYMSGKIYDDYLNMKEFTENAAHEMQTPIAVVQSKLELLLQDKDLKEEQAVSLYQSVDALNRLSKLNQGLLLLAKIENHQYQAEQATGLAAVNLKYLALFSDLIRDKGIEVIKDFNQDCRLLLHPLLADTLIINLLGNAIKYNYQDGRIKISTTPDSYVISNTSHVKPIDPGRLFKRFSSMAEGEATSNGLGLAIVKKIADTHHLTISYQAADGWHVFTINS